ncbi:unnamed protein product [Trichobilharzia regenti]|nr:unnamed protein product [Trichobilharzia regenti]
MIYIYICIILPFVKLFSDSRLPANIVNSDTGEAHTTYLAPYYQELYHPTLKPTYKTILRTPGQQISTSTPANRISNLKTHQTNFNLLQKSVKNESVQLNTFMPKTSLNKTNTEKVLEVNFNQSDSPRNGENIYDAKSINPSKCLDDKLISSLNDLHSCTVEGKTQFNDHRHQNTPTNIKILQPPLTPTQKSTYLLRFSYRLMNKARCTRVASHGLSGLVDDTLASETTDTGFEKTGNGYSNINKLKFGYHDYVAAIETEI